MDVSTFFSRLLQPSKAVEQASRPDDLGAFHTAWTATKETLEHPDERQIFRGITATDVPRDLQRLVDALVCEGNRADEEATGPCMEYFLENHILAQLGLLCERDRPRGIKREVLKAMNNLIVLLSDRFLVHNSVHRPLRRLLRSCVGDEPPPERTDGSSRTFGAAGMDSQESLTGAGREGAGAFDEELVDLMCTLCSKMRAFPPLLLILFHERGLSMEYMPLSQTPTSFDSSASVLGLPPSIPQTASPAQLTVSTLASSRASADASTRESSSHRFEFLLFSYLLRFAHREGRVGDFARAGLLFLFDIAFLTPPEEGGENLHMPKTRDGSDPLQDARDALGEYILDGDFADVMAAALGAVYSSLPSRLRIPGLADSAARGDIAASTSGGMHLGTGVSLREDEDDQVIVASSTNADVRAQLDLLLKLFGFLQDIMHRCCSPLHHADPDDSTVSVSHVLGAGISDAIVEVVQSSFLELVLYPSILECSAADGSSVAVLTYLNVILSNLDDGPLLDGMLEFLMDVAGEDPGRDRGSGSHRRRYQPEQSTAGSSFLDQNEDHAARNDYAALSDRFTLKDLVLDNMRSLSADASTAALRLLRTLLSEHCAKSARALLSVIPDPSATAFGHHPDPFEIAATILPRPVTSTDPHLQEMELYGSLLSRIDPLQGSAELTAGYSSYSADASASIMADECFRADLAMSGVFEDDKKAMLREISRGRQTFQHRLNPSDALVRTVLVLLGDFLLHTPDQNVALTGTIATLALCPHRSLAGWLLYDFAPEDPWARQAHTDGNEYLDDDDRASDESDDEFEARRREKSRLSDADPFNASVEARGAVDLPALYQVLRDVVKQVSRFRTEVEGFDRLLSERRQGLLFADHLGEAMTLMLDVEGPIAELPSLPASDAPTVPTPRRASAFGGMMSFLTPKKKTVAAVSRTVSPAAAAAAATPTNVSVSVREQAGKISGSSPFSAHYEHVLAVSLDATNSMYEASTAPAGVSSGPWSPARLPPPPLAAPGRAGSALSRRSMQSLGGATSSAASDVGVGEDESREQGSRKERSRVSLSAVLDNCVILEEFLKELVAIVSARRALGVDQVGYV